MFQKLIYCTYNISRIMYISEQPIFSKILKAFNFFLYIINRFLVDVLCTKITISQPCLYIGPTQQCPWSTLLFPLILINVQTHHTKYYLLLLSYFCLMIYTFSIMSMAWCLTLYIILSTVGHSSIYTAVKPVI